jgi:hypothetical protein
MPNWTSFNSDIYHVHLRAVYPSTGAEFYSDAAAHGRIADTVCRVLPAPVFVPNAVRPLVAVPLRRPVRWCPLTITKQYIDGQARPP